MWSILHYCANVALYFITSAKTPGHITTPSGRCHDLGHDLAHMRHTVHWGQSLINGHARPLSLSPPFGLLELLMSSLLQLRRKVQSMECSRSVPCLPVVSLSFTLLATSQVHTASHFQGLVVIR